MDIRVWSSAAACWLTVVLGVLLGSQSLEAAELPYSCLAPVTVAGTPSEMGPILGVGEPGSIGQLVRAYRGLFILLENGGRIDVVRVETDVPGEILETANLSDGGALLSAKNGLFWIQAAGPGKFVAQRLDVNDNANWHHQLLEIDSGVLVGGRDGVVLVSNHQGQLETRPLPGGQTGRVTGIVRLPGNGWLVVAQRGLFDVSRLNGELVVEPVGGWPAIGKILQVVDVPNIGTFIRADDALHLIRSEKGHLTSLLMLNKDYTTSDMHAFPPRGVLVNDYLVLRMVDTSPGERPDATLKPLWTSRPKEMHRGARGLVDLPGNRVLFGLDDRLIIVRSEDGEAIQTEVPGDRVGGLFDLVALPNGEALVSGMSGLLRVRPEGANYIAERIPGGPVYAVSDVVPLPTGEYLLNLLYPSMDGITPITKGVQLVSVTAGGELAFNPLAGHSPRGVVTTTDLRDIGVLLVENFGLSVLSRSPLERASVRSDGFQAIEGTASNPKLDTPLDFTIDHACAPLLADFGLHAELLGAGGQRETLSDAQILGFRAETWRAHVKVLLPIHSAGVRRLQFYVSLDGVRHSVGEALALNFTATDDLQKRAEWWAWLLGGLLAGVLAISNVVLFVLSRFSSNAWRIVADNSLSTRVFKVVTFVLSYSAAAQLWILDFYFQQRKSRLQGVRPFLALPLTRASTGERADIQGVLAPPFGSGRIWIQGASGMGKTALMRHFVQMYFRDHASSYAAFAHWRGIVVDFSARDFVGGEDERSSAWVVEAIKKTLSQRRLVFSDERLLQRMLRNGTIAVLIDGLHEAGRTMSVEEFTRDFPQAPLVVTSQDEGRHELFTVWRLPDNMRDFTEDLLRVYLPEAHASVIRRRIEESGLARVIQSGYDVRLLVDLARNDPESSALPADRISLYSTVVDMAWPEGNPQLREGQQERIAAAAWLMVSQRKPNEDKRRLRPELDSTAELLASLADANELDTKPIRLMRRVGNAYEFVHEQMHFYLAASWFAGKQENTAELLRLITGSAIWDDSPPARRAVWTFAAALLGSESLISLWARVVSVEEWDSLRRALEAEAQKRGVTLPREGGVAGIIVSS